jgi:hypothetical protein
MPAVATTTRASTPIQPQTAPAATSAAPSWVKTTVRWTTGPSAWNLRWNAVSESNVVKRAVASTASDPR